MSDSRATRLLAAAEAADDQLERHLLVAAALRLILSSEPIVVGGTAEQYWTDREYHPTDLDLTASLDAEDVRALSRFGFERDGRHWIHGSIPIAIEFPESRLDGDLGRTTLEPVGDGAARLIGIDDLYIDRLRQATANEEAEGIEFESALAVAAAGEPTIDWPYVEARIDEVTREARLVGESMRRLDAKIRRRVRRSL